LWQGARRWYIVELFYSLHIFLLLRTYSVKAGEMAQWLRALVAFCRGSQLGSQHPHEGSGLSLTPVPGGSRLHLLSFAGTGYTQHTDIHAIKAHVHIK